MWPGSIAACLEASIAGFVAQPHADEDDADWIQTCLRELHIAVRSGRLSSLTLIVGDSYRIKVQRADRWKFWRRDKDLFGSQT